MEALGAARTGDQIGHGVGVLGLLAGAVVGVAIGLAVVAAAPVALPALAAAAIIGGSVAGGALATHQILKGTKTIWRIPDPVTGVFQMIDNGARNVQVNGKKALRASLDTILFCSGGSGLYFSHPPFGSVLAEGSKTVHINNLPAGRIKMHTTCGAKIVSASEDVRIGGETERTNFVWDLEAGLEMGFQILGIAAIAGGAIAAAIVGAAALGGYALATAGFMGAFELLGMVGDSIGEGFRDLIQGIAGLGFLILVGAFRSKVGRLLKYEEAYEEPPEGLLFSDKNNPLGKFHPSDRPLPSPKYPRASWGESMALHDKLVKTLTPAEKKALSKLSAPEFEHYRDKLVFHEKYGDNFVVDAKGKVRPTVKSVDEIIGDKFGEDETILVMGPDHKLIRVLKPTAKQPTDQRTDYRQEAPKPSMSTEGVYPIDPVAEAYIVGKDGVWEPIRPTSVNEKGYEYFPVKKPALRKVTSKEDEEKLVLDIFGKFFESIKPAGGGNEKIQPLDSELMWLVDKDGNRQPLSPTLSDDAISTITVETLPMNRE